MTMLTLSDDGRTRVIKFNDTEYTLSLTDPYGFCMISLKEGKVPDELRNPFTSFGIAQKAVEIFENKNKLSVKKTTK